MHRDKSDLSARNRNVKLLLNPIADLLRDRELRQTHELLHPFGLHFDLFVILNPLDGKRNMHDQSDIRAVGVLNVQLFFTVKQDSLHLFGRIVVEQSEHPVVGRQRSLRIRRLAAQHLHDLIFVHALVDQIGNRLTAAALLSLQPDSHAGTADELNLIRFQPLDDPIQIAGKRSLGNVIF